MANEILAKDLTAFVWAHEDDYDDTKSGLVWTHELDLTSLADAAAQQGVKADLGATRSIDYAVLACIEMAVAPAVGAGVPIYWAGSPIVTAGNANPGGTSGVNAAYTGTAGATIAEAVNQLKLIGTFYLTDDATAVLQYMQVGVLRGNLVPRFGMPVVFNEGGQAFHNDAVEMYVALLPITPEIQ